MSVITPEATAALYAEAHERIVHLVGALDEEQAATRVPGTPLWSVHDLLAHLVAVPSELASGRLTKVPEPGQTQEAVDARKDRSVAELLDEWRAGLPGVLEGARTGLIPPPLTVDVITHEQDIRGALGAAHLDDDAALRYATSGFGFGFSRRVKAAGLPALRLLDPARGFDLTAGEGDASVTVQAPEFELFRALAGRRSRRQVAAFEWNADATPYLDTFCVFGPLPDDDVAD
jgi:uncharacterized protein (TIGR03083 family)